MAQVVASAVEICNLALDLLGEDNIVALSDGTRRADLCNRHYAPTRDLVLRSGWWNFAIARAQLAATSSTAQTWGPAWLYNLPSDCLKVLHIGDWDEGEVMPFYVEGSQIRTDETTPIYLLYVKQETDVTKFDSTYIDCLVACLAARMSYPLTASTAIKSEMEQLWRERLQFAKSQSGREGTVFKTRTDTWTNARL